MLKCKTCGKVKPLNQFGKNKQNKSGLELHCKPCKAAKKATYRTPEQIEKMRQWRKDNAVYVKDEKRKYYAENKDSIKAAAASYREENKAVISAKKRAVYVRDNPDKIGKPTGSPPRAEKVCPECGVLKPRSEYYKNLTSISHKCKKCTNDHYVNRNRKVRDRTPKWSDTAAIAEFYRNRPEGYHVDHIVPIFGIIDGREVSGLHVLNNLQYLPAHENMSKQNYITESDLI